MQNIPDEMVQWPKFNWVSHQPICSCSTSLPPLWIPNNLMLISFHMVCYTAPDVSLYRELFHVSAQQPCWISVLHLSQLPCSQHTAELLYFINFIKISGLLFSMLCNRKRSHYKYQSASFKQLKYDNVFRSPSCLFSKIIMYRLPTQRWTEITNRLGLPRCLHLIFIPSSNLKTVPPVFQVLYQMSPKLIIQLPLDNMTSLLTSFHLLYLLQPRVP